jgi:hypothetical protein
MAHTVTTERFKAIREDIESMATDQIARIEKLCVASNVPVMVQLLKARWKTNPNKENVQAVMHFAGFQARRILKERG